MITLDASLLIAYQNVHHAHHEEATGFLRDVAGQWLLTHFLNLAEILVGGARVGQEQQMLADVHAMGVTVAEPAEGDPSRLARLRVATGLKLPDCCALDTALSAGSVLAAVDHSLAAAAGARHLTVVPDRGPGAADPPG